MSFDTYETSTEQGTPVEIYDLTFASSEYRYTSNQVDVVVEANTYAAIPISRGRINRTIEKGSEGKLEIVLPGDTPFVTAFALSSAGSRAFVTVRRYHRDDPATEVILIYKGTIQTVRFEANGRRAVLQARALTSAEGRTVPRMTFQGLCNHMLYSTQCGVNKDLFKHILYVQSVSSDGKTLTVLGAGALGADYFENGYCEFGSDFRMVTAQDGASNNDLHLMVPFATSPIAQWLTFYAGCKHRLSDDCNTKFSNAVNFGGFPYVPTKNPFESGLE